MALDEMTNAELLDWALTAAKSAVEEISGMESTGFEPILQVATRDRDTDEGVINVVPLSGMPDYDDGDARHAGVNMVGRIMASSSVLANSELELVLHVSEAWMTKIALDKGVADRSEVVVIHGITADGKVAKGMSAEILRDEDDVITGVGEWQSMDGMDDALLKSFLLGYYAGEVVL